MPHTLEEIVSRLAGRFDPSAAQGFEAVFQFEIEDEQDFYIEVREQECTVGWGEHDDPNVVIIADMATVHDVVEGKVDGMSAFLKGRLRAQGNVMLATKLGKIFRRKKA